MDPQKAQSWLNEYAQNGNHAAFESLVQRYLNFVYGLALRRLNMDSGMASDVTQKVFIDVAKSAASLKTHPCFAGWLHRHTLYLAAKVEREEKRRKIREQIFTDMSSSNSSENIEAEVAEGLLHLNENDRAAILLRFYEDLSISKVAVAMGLTEAAAQKRILRALEKLREILIRRGMTASLTVISTVLTSQMTIAAPPAVAAGIMTSLTTLPTSTLLLTFMAKANLKVAMAAVVLITAGASIYWQHKTINELRDEISRRETPVQKVIPPIEEVRTDNSELLRLRAEVAQLRQHIAVTNETVRQPSIRVPTNVTPVAAASWQNRGQATPDAAMETLFWAAKNKEKETLQNLIRWRKDPQVPEWDGLSEMAQSFVAGTEMLSRKVDSFVIRSSDALDEQTRKLQVEFNMSNGKQRTEEILLSHEGGQWYPVYHFWLSKSGSIQGGMHVPAALSPENF